LKIKKPIIKGINPGKFFTFFILCLLSAGRVSGHLYIVATSDTLTGLPVDSLLNIIEKKHKIRFYYEEKMIVAQKIPVSLTDLPLDEALIRLKEIFKCTYVTVDTTSYVLMPLTTQRSTQVRDQGYLIIGNTNDYGKYKTATFTGTLRDDKTGEPLTGAVVNVKKMNIAITTDNKGKFNMNLPVGEYDLEFSVDRPLCRHLPLHLRDHPSATEQVPGIQIAFRDLR